MYPMHYQLTNANSKVKQFCPNERPYQTGDSIVLIVLDAVLYIRHVNVRMIMKANAMNMYLLDTLSNVGCIMLETFYIMLACDKASGFPSISECTICIGNLAL